MEKTFSDQLGSSRLLFERLLGLLTGNRLKFQDSLEKLRLNLKSTLLVSREEFLKKERQLLGAVSIREVAGLLFELLDDA